MIKIYSFLLFCCIATGCSKDFLKRYERRIEGTWRLSDVDRRGIGGSQSNLPFVDGQFHFEQDGGLTYTNSAGAVYQGSWDIRRQWRSGNCQTDDDGDVNCNDQQVHTLHITAIDFNSQDVKTEYFEEIIFTGTNRFKAYIRSGLHTYVFHFRR